MLFDVVNDRILHQVLDALSSLQTSPDLSGADVVGYPFCADVDVVLIDAHHASR